MKAISIRAPWWWFILLDGPGVKDIENRDWATSYRGPALIHASSWWRPADVRADIDYALAMYRSAGGELAAREIYEGLAKLQQSGGKIVGRVDIVDCVRAHKSPWFVGDHGFVLANAKPAATPFRTIGRLGLFDTPYSDEVTA